MFGPGDPILDLIILILLALPAGSFVLSGLIYRRIHEPVLAATLFHAAGGFFFFLPFPSVIRSLTAVVILPAGLVIAIFNLIYAYRANLKKTRPRGFAVNVKPPESIDQTI